MIYIKCPHPLRCSLPARAQLASPLSSLLPSVLCASLYSSVLCPALILAHSLLLNYELIVGKGWI